MRFEEFWKILIQKISTPTEFNTLHRKKLFSASYSKGRITIRPEKTKSDRHFIKIPSKEFEKKQVHYQKMNVIYQVIILV